MELTDFQKGYIAALIDGEGSVCLTALHANEHKSPVVSVASTTEELLIYMQKICGGSISKKRKQQEHYKDSWQWSIKRDKAIELLTEIYPYLLVPEKHYRAKLIVKEYKQVTIRNGRYNEETLKRKLDFEDRFLKFDANY